MEQFHYILILLVLGIYIIKFQHDENSIESMQNSWTSKCKNDTKNDYYFNINGVFFLLVMSSCEVHIIYILTKSI